MFAYQYLSQVLCFCIVLPGRHLARCHEQVTVVCRHSCLVAEVMLEEERKQADESKCEGDANALVNGYYRTNAEIGRCVTCESEGENCANTNFWKERLSLYGHDYQSPLIIRKGDALPMLWKYLP